MPDVEDAIEDVTDQIKNWAEELKPEDRREFFDELEQQLKDIKSDYYSD